MRSEETLKRRWNIAGVGGIRDRATQASGAALLGSGTQVPTCPGTFRDMAMSLPANNPFKQFANLRALTIHRACPKTGA